MQIVNTISKKKLRMRLLESELEQKLIEMGNSVSDISKFQLKRIQRSLLMIPLFVVLGIFLSEYCYIGAIIAPVILYKSQGNKINSYYVFWQFERRMQFSKFMRILIPYLKEGNTRSLYSIFNKILERLEKEEDRKSLYRLMSEMSNNPNHIKPFDDYADRSSGTDMARLFMNTIYDFQQSTKDASVIEELGRNASEELLTVVDEVVNFKVKKFVMYPTKLLMSTFIITLGFAFGVLWLNIKNTGFNGF